MSLTVFMSGRDEQLVDILLAAMRPGAGIPMMLRSVL